MNAVPAEPVSRPDRRPAGPKRSADVREAILAAAAALAAEQGFAAASIEAIARRAGAGKQTIYRWWPGRGALFMEVYRSLVSADRLRGVASDDPTADVEVILGRLFRLYGKCAAGAVLAGLIALSADDAPVQRELREGLMFGARDVLAAPLEGAVRRGVLPSRFNADIAVETAIALVGHQLLAAPGSLDGAFARSVARRAVACGMLG